MLDVMKYKISLNFFEIRNTCLLHGVCHHDSIMACQLLILKFIAQCDIMKDVGELNFEWNKDDA